jgi:hypothetical protein
VTARQHQGPSTEENLALCCDRCNSHKGTNLTSLDPASGQMTRLFNPRLDQWADHFRWEGVIAVGVTDVGRTTVRLLRMNDPVRVALREHLLAEGSVL